jgi:hypothetical protein
MNPSPVNDPSPADLLSNFNGRSLKSIIVFTLVVHAALLLGTGGPYLWRSLFGADSSKMSESERMDLAFKEASASMRRIAEEHGLKPQDLGNRFSNPVAAPAPAPAAATATPATPAAPAATEAKVDTAPRGGHNHSARTGGAEIRDRTGAEEGGSRTGGPGHRGRGPVQVTPRASPAPNVASPKP